MTYSVNIVARYILQKSGEISALKLQKLTYYCQAWNLVFTNKSLIKEDFEAWVLGPVCPELYELHRKKYRLTKKDIPAAPNQTKDDLDGESIDTIDTVLEAYGHLSGYELSDLSHTEEPWLNARDAFNPGEKRVVITKQSMTEYYGRLRIEEGEEE